MKKSSSSRARKDAAHITPLPDNHIRVRAVRRKEIDATKLSLAFWLLAKQLQEEKQAEENPQDPVSDQSQAEQTESGVGDPVTPRPVPDSSPPEPDVRDRLAEMLARHQREVDELLAQAQDPTMPGADPKL